MVFTEKVQNETFRITTEFKEPLVCGENGNFTVWLENITDKPIQNFVLREKTFKVTTIPFDLAPHEKCTITFNVDVSNDFEYSPSLQFEFLKVLPPFPWEFYEGAAEPEFQDRIYEPAETTIASVFRLYRKAEARIPFKVKMGKLTLENKTKHVFNDSGFPPPKKTNETGGALVFNLEGRDYAVVQAYLMPSESDAHTTDLMKGPKTHEILFWLVPCTVELVTKNKRVARVKFAENMPIETWMWRFIRDKASDFQIVMDFLSKRYNESWLLHVIFDGQGGYQFENLLVIP